MHTEIAGVGHKPIACGWCVEVGAAPISNIGIRTFTCDSPFLTAADLVDGKQVVQARLVAKFRIALQAMAVLEKTAALFLKQKTERIDMKARAATAFLLSAIHFSSGIRTGVLSSDGDISPSSGNDLTFDRKFA